MKTIKITIGMIAMAILASTTFTACNKEEAKEKTVAKPIISNLEIGYENSKKGHPGGDLHIEANIVAEGVIDFIRVEIHHEGEHHNHEHEWEVDTTYTSSKYSGAKNATFHEHIHISDQAEVGHYHFLFIVRDKQGNQLSVEEEIEIVDGEGDNHDHHGHDK